MNADAALASKTENEENFPVASRLIAPRFRATILAFYRFARKADDVADHPDLAPQAKLDKLAALDESCPARATPSPKGGPYARRSLRRI